MAMQNRDMEIADWTEVPVLRSIMISYDHLHFEIKVSEVSGPIPTHEWLEFSARRVYSISYQQKMYEINCAQQ